MLDEVWLRQEVSDLLDCSENTLDSDQLLSELAKHSLKLVTFLARFNKQYGSHPAILEFIKAPSVKLLNEVVMNK